jgi:hypothetical protein
MSISHACDQSLGSAPRGVEKSMAQSKQCDGHVVLFMALGVVLIAQAIRVSWRSPAFRWRLPDSVAQGGRLQGRNLIS